MMDNNEKKWTMVYDKYLDRATLNESIVLSRLGSAELVLGKGNQVGNMKDLQAAKGSIVTAAGNMSFSAASEGLSIGDVGKNVEYKLHIPGGTVGSGMWIGDKRINGFGASQREFLTNRDIAFRVGDTIQDGNKFVVEIEFLQQ